MRGVNAGASKAKFDSQLLDQDFDDIEGFADAVLSSIERCGTIDIHPNGWGSHDYLGVNTANMHYMPGGYAYSFARLADKEASKPRLSERDAREKHLYDWAHPKLLSFPHSTAAIAHDTATEFAQFGQDDARRRSITDDEWIWKRSRFMAGFK